MTGVLVFEGLFERVPRVDAEMVGGMTERRLYAGGGELELGAVFM